MKKIILCSWCINGLKSHGERVYVGELVDPEENAKCEFCEDSEDSEELFECVWE